MNEWLISLSEYIGGMSDELDNANSENAKLRELVEEDSEQLDKWQKKAEYYSQLSQLAEAENAKLRKLVKEAHLCMVNEGCCEDCYATYGECPIEMDMRELGIEVDG